MSDFWIVPLLHSVSDVMSGKETRIWCSAVGNTAQILTTGREPGTLMHIHKHDDVWRTDVRCPLLLLGLTYGHVTSQRLLTRNTCTEQRKL